MSRGGRHREGLQAQRAAEAAGQVADSLEVRMALIARMDAGELTLQQVQAELKRIKRAASSNGQVTRAQAYRGIVPAAQLAKEQQK